MFFRFFSIFFNLYWQIHHRQHPHHILCERSWPGWPEHGEFLHVFHIFRLFSTFFPHFSMFLQLILTISSQAARTPFNVKVDDQAVWNMARLCVIYDKSLHFFRFFQFFLHFIRYNTFVNATSIQQCSNPLLAPAVSSYTVGLVALNLGSEGWRWYLFHLVQCLGSGGSFRRVPPLASGTSTFVCRHWHLVDFGFWGNAFKSMLSHRTTFSSPFCKTWVDMSQKQVLTLTLGLLFLCYQWWFRPNVYNLFYFSISMMNTRQDWHSDKSSCCCPWQNSSMSYVIWTTYTKHKLQAIPS